MLIDGIEGSLADLNPNDIESFTILKDAASSAIYGSRAANGVVLVQTKKGEKGDLRVEYNGYVGWQDAYRLTEPVSNSVEYMQMLNQALANEGKNPQYTQDEINEFKKGTDPYIYPNTNWVDVLFGTAKMTEHNLRFSGGLKNTTYALSLGYLNQDGVLVGTWSNRYSFRLNLDSKVSEKMTIGVRVSGSMRQREQSQYYSNTTGVLRGGFRALPVIPPYLEDGKYGASWLKPARGLQNPLVTAKEGIVTQEFNRYDGNIFAEYNILPGLKLKGTLAVNRHQTFEPRFIPKVYQYDAKAKA